MAAVDSAFSAGLDGSSLRHYDLYTKHRMTSEEPEEVLVDAEHENRWYGKDLNYGYHNGAQNPI